MPRTKPYVSRTDDRLAALASQLAFALLTPQPMPDQILSILASDHASATGKQLARVLHRRYSDVLACCRDLAKRRLLRRERGRWVRVRTGDEE